MDHISIVSTSQLATQLATLESIMALADQIRAATSDCWAAWSDFKVGVTPESSSRTEVDAPVPTDRMERIANQVQADVGRLRELAQEIRNRS